MTVLARQQCHILTSVATNAVYNSTEFWTRVSNDIINLLDRMTLAGDVFLPIPLRAMGENAVPVGCRCVSLPPEYSTARRLSGQVQKRTGCDQIGYKAAHCDALSDNPLSSGGRTRQCPS